MNFTLNKAIGKFDNLAKRMIIEIYFRNTISPNLVNAKRYRVLLARISGHSYARISRAVGRSTAWVRQEAINREFLIGRRLMIEGKK